MSDPVKAFEQALRNASAGSDILDTLVDRRASVTKTTTTPLFTGKPKKESPEAAKTVAELKQDVADIRGRLEAMRADAGNKISINAAVRQCNNHLDALNKL